MHILRESMTRIVLGNYTVRVWREEPDLVVEPSNEDLIREAEFFYRYDVGGRRMELLKRLLEFPRVNAVEVIDLNGDGDVVYRDWP